MKNTQVLLIAVTLILSIKLSAQNDYKFGVNFGINYPTISGHDYAKYNNFNVGYLFGVSFDYRFKENLSLIANVNYETKIKKLRLIYFDNGGNETETENITNSFNYINLPILVKYEFGNSKFFANSGPFFNFLVSKVPQNDGLTDMKKIDFGISMGIGTSIALNEKNGLLIEIRDDFGLIDTGGVPKHLAGGSVKTNAIKLILAFNFGT